MNIILLKPEDFVNETVVKIDDYRHLHISGILNAKSSSVLRVGMINGKRGTGRIIESGPYTEMEVSLTDESPAPLNITLVLALPRPKVLKRVVYNATTLGIKYFHIINSWRVDKSYWYSDAVADGYLDSTIISALEQAMDTVVPKIAFHRFFSKFADKVLPGIMEGTDSFIAHPGRGPEKTAKREKPVTLAVGPEGGFIRREVDRFLSMGFKELSLGERILKVETAVTALITRLM